MAEETRTGTSLTTERSGDLFETFRSEMDRIFEDFLGRGLISFPRTFGAPARRQGAVFSPSIDVRENEKEIVIEAELPGMEEQDIDVEMRDDILTIKGEKKFEEEKKGENYYMAERRYGSFQRSLRVPDTVDPDRVEAKFDKGVLTVTLPKRPEAVREPRKIQVAKG